MSDASASWSRLEEETDDAMGSVKCLGLGKRNAGANLPHISWPKSRTKSQPKIIETSLFPLQDDTNLFSPAYEMWSDIGSDLFVLSSATRLFIYYKYNPDVRRQLKTLHCGLPEFVRHLNDVAYLQKPSNGVSV